MLRNRSHLGKQHGSQCLQVVFACLDELHEQPRRTTRLEEFHELSRRTAMPRLPFFREKHRAGCALTTAICRSYRPARCCGNDVIEHPKLHYSYLWQGVPLLDVLHERSRDIHLHTHPTVLYSCGAGRRCRWTQFLSIGTPQMPYNALEWHVSVQMNVTRAGACPI